MVFDYKKEYKEFYMPKNKPSIIKIPKMNYIAVRGKGNPNEENSEYKESIGLLYAIAFTIKMSYKGTHKINGYFEYVVPPLEGFWWQEGNTSSIDYRSKDQLNFISIIRLPDFVTKEDFEWAVQEATNKKKQDFSKVEFLTYEEGICVQCMHIGSYDDEPSTINLMHEYVKENGYELDITDSRFHHEIYLSDPRRCDVNKLKTVIRHPIRKGCEYINLTVENIEKEHICCAIGDPKHQEGVESKKEWIKSKLKDGHVFRKLNARGKIFIEYEPIETAWVPVSGKNYEYIYCLWVAGSFKGKGIGRELLEYAIKDAKEKGKSGICTLVSKKKKPFLGEKKFFEHYGFKVVDSISDYELLALQWNDKETPKFNDSARNMKIDNQEFTIYYSPECPYVEYEVKELTEYAKENNIKINFIKIDSLEKAKNVPCVFNNWANFYKGEFISNTILNSKSFEKLIS